MKQDITIGLVGGMGPYATVDLFRRLVDAFPTEKDWEKPHIIVDSNSQIPSRVRAILYNEKRDEVVGCLAKSITSLMKMGADKIIVGCHTAHIFLPDAIKVAEDSQNVVVNIIDETVNYCKNNGFSDLRLLASEGTVEVGIYTDSFKPSNICIHNPSGEELVQIRKVMEAVKQNKISEETVNLFYDLINTSDCPVLLGCSELPVMYRICKERGKLLKSGIVDPFQVVIDGLVRENDIH